MFNYRTRLTGARVILDPSIRCRYFAEGSLRQLAIQYFRYGWAKAAMLKAFPLAVRARQVVPGGFAALLSVLLLLGLVSHPARFALAVVLLAYGLVLFAAAWQLARSPRRWRAIPACVAAFGLVHLSWGFGACVNVITLGQWPVWLGSHRTATPRERGLN